MKTRGFERVSRVIDNPDYILPKRSTKHSIGYDFYSPITAIIPAGGFIKIETGIKSYFQTDEGLFFYARSGLGSKHGIILRNNVGVFEADYYNNESNEGEAIITLYNLSEADYELKKGDKYCQAVFQKILLADDDNSEELETRKGGLGSTGIN